MRPPVSTDKTAACHNMAVAVTSTLAIMANTLYAAAITPYGLRA